MRHTVSILFLSALVFAFTACDAPSPNRTSAPARSTGNAAHDRMLELDPATRAAALGTAVTSTDYPCKGTEAFFMGLSPNDNSALWSVRCANGKAYEVSIDANATGTTNVMDCAVLKAVADVDCFAKLDTQNDRPRRTKKQIDADLKRLSPALRKQMMDRMRENAGRP